MLFQHKEKALMFDAGPIISLTTNNLLWLVEKLAADTAITFMIPEHVKNEVVDVPLNTKKFKYEAIQILRQIEKGTFKVVNGNLIDKSTEELTLLANTCFFAHNNPIQILHKGEIQCIAACKELKVQTLAVDERTTRALIEEPMGLKKHLEKKLHTTIEIQKKNLSRIRDFVKDIKVLRSSEIVAVAYERGLLDGLLPNLVDSKELLLDSLLWGLKLQGCAISSDDIERIKSVERKKR